MTGSLKQYEAALDLDDLVEQMEAIDWRDVPAISTPEAAVWTQRCIEAIEEMASQQSEIEEKQDH